MLFDYRNTVHTITSDNGSEFTKHELMAKKLNAYFYFAHPYSSWERGLSEYTNKLILQYIIKYNTIHNDYFQYASEAYTEGAERHYEYYGNLFLQY